MDAIPRFILWRTGRSCTYHLRAECHVFHRIRGRGMSMLHIERQRVVLTPVEATRVRLCKHCCPHMRVVVQKRCAKRWDGFRCTKWAGHEGEHYALAPTGYDPDFAVRFGAQ